MKQRSHILAFLVGLVLLTGCATVPEFAVRQNSPSGQASETISPAKQRIRTESPSPSASPTSAETSTPRPGQPQVRTNVVWSDYDADLKPDIDRATSAGDCQGIESFYGMATATEDSVMAFSGHGNQALVAYLDEAVKLATCP
jgi:hypothetical protein